MNEIVKVEASSAAIASVLGVTPAALMEQAVIIANTLTKVLREQGMVQKFGPGEHVKAEGWQLAGSLLGFVANEKGDPEELPDGSFVARAELYHPATDRVLANASGYCGVDEPTWRGKPKYARRGMAVTRSIGRVYANNFRWLIKLAGFSPTPAEEMGGDRGPPFDPKNKVQAERLTVFLTQKKKLDSQDAAVILERMAGKYSDELDEVINQWLAEQTI